MDALDRKPRLSAVEGWYFNAFAFLSIGRPVGMGPSAIPLADFSVFHSTFGGPHDLPVFTRILRSIDSAYLAEQRKD